MRRVLTALILGAWLVPAAPLLVGCDETLEHERKVEVKDDGTTVEKEKKVTESPDGTITKTEEKKVSE
jgi:hypothetical protein